MLYCSFGHNRLSPLVLACLLTVGTYTIAEAADGDIVGETDASNNTASGTEATVTGGLYNLVDGDWASITGGYYNKIHAKGASISGGNTNTITADGIFGSVSGGEFNQLEGRCGSINGGFGNHIYRESNNGSISGGANNQVHGDYASILGGRGNSANGAYSAAVGGYYNAATGEYSVVDSGYHNKASGDYAWAAGGKNSLASGDYSTAIGGGKAYRENSIAIGAGAEASEPNQISFGGGTDKDGNTVYNRLTNVGDGVNAHDAATYGQLSNVYGDIRQRLGGMDSKIEKVGAGAAALAALHPLPDGGKFQFAGGVGAYRSQQALALGVFYRPTDNIQMNMGASAGTGETMVNFGISFALGKKAVLSRNDLEKKVESLEAANQKKDELLQELLERVDMMQRRMDELEAEKRKGSK